MNIKLSKIVLAMVSILCLTSMTFAHWDVGDPYKMHFPQLPDPNGWDICLHEQAIADDFLCTETGPITDIHFWVSWQADEEDWANTTWTIQIWSNLPGGPCGGGMPGALLWTWNGLGNFVVRQPAYQGNEGWHCPSTGLTVRPDHYLYWQINITDINEPFTQEEGTTYWLVIRANKPVWPPAVGWKTSLNRFQSCSLWSAGAAAWQPVLAGSETVDQAFVITSTTHEPNEPNEPNIPNTKYIQRPDLTSTGMDLRVDDTDGVCRYIADDFPCNTPGPITDVHFWGSWKNDIKGSISTIVLSFYSDLPAGPNNPYSKPDELLWRHLYNAGDFNETLYRDIAPKYEWWWDPMHSTLIQYGDHQIWKYDINIDPRMAFRQQGTSTNPKVYWMSIEVWLPYGQIPEFGWKTSRQHWNDDAVWDSGNLPERDWSTELQYPQGHPYCPNSIDMAFALTTGAEPNMPTDPNTKFKQPPDEGPNGIDIRCDRRDGVPRILADDFVCFETGAITDVHLWGSWLGEPAMKGQIDFIHLSIHNDIPLWQNPAGGYYNYSMPGPVLWERDFYPGDFKETLYKTMTTYYEGWWDPSAGGSGGGYIPMGDRQIWQYDIVIPPSVAFIQQGEPNNPIIYWLDVYVQIKPDSNLPNAQFGWKTSTEHFNDNAVYFDMLQGNWQPLRYPEMHPQMGEPVDMAFSITNKKECLKPWATEYTDWVNWGKPKCWCFKRQCRGDINGTKNIYWVSLADFNVFKVAYQKSDTVLRGITNGICADLNHTKNIYRVSLSDFTIFKAHYQKPDTSVKCCDLDMNCTLQSADKYLFWTN